MIEPKLLRVPQRFKDTQEVIACASRMDFRNILILSQREDGGVVFLHSNEMTMSEANWLVDNAKRIILGDA